MGLTISNEGKKIKACDQLKLWYWNLWCGYYYKSRHSWLQTREWKYACQEVIE